jgi:outer membrane immunogenic protein
MNKIRAAAGVACALFAGSAMAADLPSRKAEPVYVPPPPAFTWTGLYGGVNIGYGFGNGDQDQGALAGSFATYNAAGLQNGTVGGFTGWGIQNNIQGVLGGGQAGYNYQFNPWLVLGLEADIQAADLHTQTNAVTGDGNRTYTLFQNKAVDWFGTLRGRIGFTPLIPNLLIYGTGGFAYGQVVHNFGVNAYDVAGNAVLGQYALYDDTKFGWTAGGGVEWSPTGFPAWSVKVEYLYTDLGATNLNGVALWSVPGSSTFAYNHNSETRFHTVRAGLNWHFNPFAPAPVVAKF